jgi:hypothetical protein
VTQQQATVGVKSALTTNATFQYYVTSNADQTLSGYTNIIDAYNRTTRYDFVSSQLAKVTDPLGQTVQTVWYQPASGYVFEAVNISAGSRTALRQYPPETSYISNSWGSVSLSSTVA